MRNISDADRVLEGRSMISNILDIDFAARIISLTSRTGVMIFFDCKAAFPSVSHDMLWDTLLIGGIDTKFIQVLKHFYNENRHILKLNGDFFPGVHVRSGVRQGCPLSGILFAMCVDVLLIKLQRVMRQGEDLRAFADDIGGVFGNYTIALPILAVLFQEFQSISALQLNVKKTVLVPLWPATDTKTLRVHIKECCAFWKDIVIDSHCKYLGFVLGPGAGGLSWSKPLAKFEKAVAQWSSLKLGLFLNTLAYNVYMVTLLEYVAQLLRVDDRVVIAEQWALRKLAPGPGMWIMPADLENLTVLGHPMALRSIVHTAMASKLRICATIARDSRRRHRELDNVLLDNLRRPLGDWHSQSLYSILEANRAALQDHGITVASVRADPSCAGRKQDAYFQRAARAMIQATIAPFNAENRIRHKLERWNLSGPPAHLARRACLNFTLVQDCCRPCVASAYLRTLWNGWPTTHRMRTLQGTVVIGCVFGCQTAVDRIEHYAVCPAVWAFLQKGRPSGLGIDRRLRSLQGLLLLEKGMNRTEKLAMAIGVYALARSVAQARSSTSAIQADRLLSLHAREGLRGSKARRELAM